MNNETIDEQIAALAAAGNTWSKGLPYGTVSVERGTQINRTIKLPCRVGLAGDGAHGRGHPTIEAADDWNSEDRWAIECDYQQEAGQANGNFNSEIRDLSLMLYRRCSGILFRGAQMSKLSNVSVAMSNLWVKGEKEFKDKSYQGRQIGIYSARGGRNITVERCEAMGFHYYVPTPFEQIGIYLASNSGVDGSNNSWHKCRWGMAFDTTHSVRMANQVFERTVTPFIFADSCSDVHLDGCPVETMGTPRNPDTGEAGINIIADLSGKPLGLKPAGPQIRISGRVFKATGGGAVYYVDRSGELQMLIERGADKQNGQVFDATL